MAAPSPMLIKALCAGLLLFSLYCLLSVPADLHSASQLEASPLCSAQDVPDCVREVKVTIVSTYRSKSGAHVNVTLPNGGDADLRLMQNRRGFYQSLEQQTLDLFVPSQEVTAYQWRGKLVAVQSANGKLPTSNDPYTGQLLNLLIGVCGLLIAGFKLWPDVVALLRK